MTEHERGARIVDMLHVGVCPTERCVDLERLHEIMLPEPCVTLAAGGRLAPQHSALWELLLLYAGGGVTLGVGGFLLMRRLVPSLGARTRARAPGPRRVNGAAQSSIRNRLPG
jgi:hypothetical protein